MMYVHQQHQVLVAGRVFLDQLMNLVLEIEMDLELEMVHLTVPPGQALLLVQMICSFITGYITNNNEDEDEDNGRNTGHFQSITK